MGENYCCRLSEETIIAIVRNRSGIDSGEIDYNLKCEKFDNLSQYDLGQMLKTIKVLQSKCEDKLKDVAK